MVQREHRSGGQNGHDAKEIHTTYPRMVVNPSEPVAAEAESPTAVTSPSLCVRLGVGIVTQTVAIALGPTEAISDDDLEHEYPCTAHLGCGVRPRHG